MPRLLRLRFVSVGHSLARMNDLALDFRDRDGRATDAALWLRNGGGKSSILNLFFALLRPHRSEFLGGKADARQRSLGDYILSEDRAVVIAEWELDAAAGSLDLDVERYVTGVFYERRDTAGEFRRLFFATRVVDAHPETTLDGLPLYTSDADGKRARRTLVAFREAWLSLRDRLPHLGVSATERQREWHEILESARIDSKLFAYQVRMNLREGGADELFRFSDAEDFIDFLLELALDPALGEQVSHNIGTYRRELLQRKEQLLPERELVAGMIERLEPLRRVRDERQALGQRLGQAHADISALERWSARRIEALVGVEAVAEEAQRAHAAAAARSQQEARALLQRDAALRRHAAQIRLARLEEERENAHELFRQAQRQARIWTAAVPLRDALRFEQRARDYHQQIEEREAKHAPLRQRLGEAAHRLVAGLRWRGRDLRQRAAVCSEDAAAAREEANAYRDTVAEATARRATATEQVRHLEAQLNTAKQERQRLIADDVLGAGEGATAAVERLEALLREHDAALARMVEEQERRDASLESLDASYEAAVAECAAAERSIEELEAARSQGWAERQALEEASMLHVALELETPDLDRLGDEAASTLDARARREQEQVVEVRLARANDERAALHIRDRGLLPPSTDVQRVLNALETRLDAAWSGWSWIANNVPSGQMREVVRRVPHLAQGVVVRPNDLDRAREILQEAACEPDGPVVLASTDAFEQAGARVGEVLGPAEHAWFDRDAARNKLVTLQVGLNAHDARIREAEQHQRELLDLRARLEAFRRRYPRGWFAAQEARIERTRQHRDEVRERRDILGGERRAIREQRKQYEVERERRQRVRASDTARLDRAQRYHEQHEAPAASWRAAQQRAIGERDEAEKEISAWSDMAGEADGRAEAATAEASRLGEDARSIEEEASKVEYTAAGAEISPVQGALDTLRAQYRQLRVQYEHEVDAAGLLALAKESEAEAWRARQSLQRLLSEEVTERDAREALDGLGDSDGAEEVRQQTSEQAASLQGRLGQIAGRLESARKGLQDADDTCRKRDVVSAPERAPAEPEIAEAEAGRCASDAEACDVRAREEWASAERAKSEADTARAGRNRLEGQRDRLRGLQSGYTDLLPVPVAASPADAASDGAAVEEATFSERIAALETLLREARDAWRNLDRQRNAAAQDVRTWLSDARFERLESMWTRRFLEHDEESLEGQAPALAEQLALRCQHLDAQIADADRHRDILVDAVLGVADEGLKLLRSADRHSRLPDHLPGLGGAQFLRITTATPDDPAERRGRIGQLVDELADSDRAAGGVALVQAAVRRLARPIQVRVLHPDPALERRLVSIAEMARFSGGEQLTGAILLYCTLARLRARSRGLSQRSSSVLVLDNPIGRASRARFLELQREVARAMGVQLVYTTGVNDYEALRALPIVIRLRNERMDRNRGHRLLEHVPDEGLEVTRVARSEEAAVAAVGGQGAARAVVEP